MTIADWSAKSVDQTEASLCERRIEPGIRRGSAAKSSSVRTSMSVGHLAVPIRRASLSGGMMLIDDMMRPWLERAGRDSLAVASWGDRFPHGRLKWQRVAFCQA